MYKSMKKFTPQQRKWLKDNSFEIFTLTGKSIKDLKKDGMRFWSTWHEGAAFEDDKSQVGEVAVKMDIQGLGKTYQECEELAKNENAKILSAASCLEIMHQHYKKTGTYWLQNNWTWTTSRLSDGHLVNMGGFGSNGAGVGAWEPGDSGPALGVVLSWMPGSWNIGALETPPLALKKPKKIKRATNTATSFPMDVTTEITKRVEVGEGERFLSLSFAPGVDEEVCIAFDSNLPWKKTKSDWEFFYRALGRILGEV